MQRATQKARLEFILLLTQHTKGHYDTQVVRVAEKLLRYGATLGRLAEEQCNGYQTWDGREDERRARLSDAKEERIRLRAQKLAESIGCKIVTQGDPRGNVLKIQVPDGYTNDWGREGIAVPTS
jgi:hypothetical protein